MMGQVDKEKPIAQRRAASFWGCNLSEQGFLILAKMHGEKG